MSTSSRTFWKAFSRTHWEKKALVEKNFESSVSGIDEDQIFQMLVSVSDRCRRNQSSSGFKLYLGGELQYEQNTLQFLPTKADRSLTNYHVQMAKLFPDYCLVCDELLQASQDHWQSLTELTRGLFDQVGFPNRFAELGLYLGNYRKTPFGVHVDACGVFSFPVIGKKKFRLWTSPFVKRHPDLVHAHDYARFKKHSKVLTVGPGDMSYWPSSAWHIAESDGSFSATWSLGVWLDRTHQDNLETALVPLLKSKIGRRGMGTVLKQGRPKSNGQMPVLPAVYEESLTTLAKVSENEIHDALLKHWLQKSSLDGFKTPPQSIPKKLQLQSLIQMRPSQKILWSALKATPETVFAYQGTLLSFRCSKEFRNLIHALNNAMACRVGDYLKSSTGKRDLKYLQKLAASGAFSTTLPRATRHVTSQANRVSNKSK